MADSIVDGIGKRLGALFPIPVVSGVMAVSEHGAGLFPDEKEQAASYGDKRLLEFASTRVLLRGLMKDLGVEAQPILSGKNREPLWPQGLVGSISHSGGVVLAALSESGHHMSLGVDLEMRAGLDPKLFAKILLPEEEALLAGMDETEASRLALLFFSAKEAFYKAQFPLTESFLGFHALQLGLPDSKSNVSFTILDEGVKKFLRPFSTQIKAQSTDNFAIASCWIGWPE